MVTNNARHIWWNSSKLVGVRALDALSLILFLEPRMEHNDLHPTSSDIFRHLRDASMDLGSILLKPSLHCYHYKEWRVEETFSSRGMCGLDDRSSGGNRGL